MDRVGLVTASNTAELAARHDTGAISRLGIFINRYCLTLFLPVGIFLTVYGAELIRAWIRQPEYVVRSAPLLPILLLGTTFGIAAQFNSSSILYGMAKHRWFARGMLAEGLALIAALWFIVPRYGILGAAWAASILMLVDRGIFTPWLLCHHLGYGFGRYLLSIYTRPLLTAAPVALFAWWLKRSVLPGNSLIQVLAAGAAISLLYYGGAFFTCLNRDHRDLVKEWVTKRLRIAAQPA